MAVPDPHPVSIALLSWYDRDGVDLSDLPTELFSLLEALVYRVGTPYFHLFQPYMGRRERDLLGVATPIILLRHFDLYRRWEQKYLSVKWLRARIPYLKRAPRGKEGDFLMAALQRRIAQDLLDLARSLDPDYQYARQQVNKVARDGGYPRCTLDGRNWIGPKGLDPCRISPVDAMDLARARSSVDTRSAPTPKYERARWWTERFFEACPNRRISVARLVHEMLNLLTASDAPGSASSAKQESCVAAKHLFNRLSAKYGSNCTAAIIQNTHARQRMPRSFRRQRGPVLRSLRKYLEAGGCDEGMLRGLVDLAAAEI